ncbi:D-beta-hydroxybutyrate dehydrogenase, mitochondrial [Leptopilina boulardi]|uniref:D-beta-hydroxybutyrate dehydrogenase, mitochondrial n=1 Tax=Leptopilina boulardi TaxID=63433 RepID=UPI0021F5122C|nr:D-beta-hydroxybutyrate dehydrogenase, mitochondrial [Leptopilina boulardi]XP_051157846.1 D-beta-hydroxybutyrate dehydrogenase, mitochondrial [Leptopilina boulardi]XP_051157847.1 D-beta-hydroxybutyrate dehydrogenase, mitochondrial [Leptopilina boulardi]XP_051157848.1 D-beta-hydroxybutyrate dehydrogenase, mitochondrial [Leptopilina boulardi]
MDVETGAVVALQILAICSIVAALLAYLMRQSRNTDEEFEMRCKRHVLVTSCDTCIGLQIALSLSEAGYKVFAGLLQPEGNSHAIKILRAVQSQREKDQDPSRLEGAVGLDVRAPGQIVPLELDPTREDSLRACLDAVRSKLPAGEDGLWAVVHTGGLALPGIIEKQESCAWESMLRHNLVAPLRTARVFIPLLRAKRGRIILLGDSGSSHGTGLVAFSASRKAVEGAAEALRTELTSSGIDVVLLKPPPVNPLALYATPVLKTSGNTSSTSLAEAVWTAPLTAYSVTNSLSSALISQNPKVFYDMDLKPRIFCR